jgi:hypothetical protein
MAGETFGDPKTMEAISAAAQRMSGSMEQTKVFAGELNTALNDVLRTSEAIGKGLRDVGADEETINSYQKIHESLVGDASALGSIISAGKKINDQDKKRTKELDVQKKMLKEMRTLTKQLASDAARKQAIDEDIAKKQAKAATEKRAKDDEEKKRNSYINRQTAATLEFLEKTAGVGGIIVKNNKSWELSISGVLTLLLEMFNIGTKMGGYAKQAAAQFTSFRGNAKASAVAIGAASKATWDLKNRFAMSAEEAGTTVAHLAKAGIEEKDLGTYVQKRVKGQAEYQSLGARMMGVQFAQQRSVEEQVKNIMDLRNNFSMLVSSAQTFDALMGDIGRRIPGLAPEQAVADIQDMAKGMRMFNLDVLDSMTLFHSLSRDAEDYRRKVAEAREKAGPGGKFEAPKITSGWGGIVSAPMNVQRKFMQFLGGAGNQSWGAQSIIGRRMRGGATVPDQIENYQSMLKQKGGAGYVDAFRGMIEDVKEKTGGMGKAQRVGIVDYLQQVYGADQELAKYLAENILSGNYNTKTLDELKKTYEKDMATMEEEAKKKETLGQDLLKVGSEIAINLKSVQEWLRTLLESKLVGPVMALTKKIGELIDTLKVAYSEKFPTKAEFSGLYDALTEGSDESEGGLRKRLTVAGAGGGLTDALVEDLKKRAADSVAVRREASIKAQKEDPKRPWYRPVSGGGLVGKWSETATAEKTEFSAPLYKLKEQLERLRDAKGEQFRVASDIDAVIRKIQLAIDAHNTTNEVGDQIAESQAGRAAGKATAHAAGKKITKAKPYGYNSAPLQDAGSDRRTAVPTYKADAD